MACYYCKSPVSKNNQSSLCVDCKFDKSITISHTNAKKVFFLIDNELISANIFCYKYSSHGNTCRIYIRDEVDKLAKNIFEKQKLSDKRKTKYLRKRDEMENIKELNNFIINNIEEAYQEYTFASDIYQKYAKKPNDFYKIIGKQLLENYYEKSARDYTMKQRAKLIDNSIKKELPNENFKNIKNFHFYTTYVTDFDQNLDITIDLIKKKLLKNKIKKEEEDKRKKVLEKKLENIGLQLRQDSKLCSFYIMGGIDTVNFYYEGDAQLQSVDDIIAIMDEMNFYHTKTNYPSINKNLIYEYTDKEVKYDFSDDESSSDDYYHEKGDWDFNGYNHVRYNRIKSISEINREAKIIVLKRWLKKYNIKNNLSLEIKLSKLQNFNKYRLPKNIIELALTL
jgi:hypothetical protein